MRINSINTQSFKGQLIIPQSFDFRKKESSPEISIDTYNIIKIDNSNYYYTDILYMNNNNLKEHKFYKSNEADRTRILFAYTAAAASKNIIITA